MARCAQGPRKVLTCFALRITRLALEVLKESAFWTLHVTLVVVQNLVSFDRVAGEADVGLTFSASQARVVTLESEGHAAGDLVDLGTSVS